MTRWLRGSSNNGGKELSAAGYGLDPLAIVILASSQEADFENSLLFNDEHKSFTGGRKNFNSCSYGSAIVRGASTTSAN